MVIYLVHLLRKVLLYHTDKKGYEELVEEFEKLGLEGEGRKERERWEDEEIRLEES